MILTVNALHKKFGKVVAVDGVSFDIPRGQFAALIGPNGAGKTTIIHAILGLITPDQGTIRLFGKTMRKHDPQIMQRINFTSPNASFPSRLTVMENLMVLARLYRVSHPKQIITELLEEFFIRHLSDRPVSALSSGEIARMALCKAFINEPELLLLDEPTAYMDPFIAERTRSSLMALQRQRKTTILITSHNMREVERFCDHVIVLVRGQVVSAGEPLEVTCNVLQEARTTPSLGEVFDKVAAVP